MDDENKIGEEILYEDEGGDEPKKKLEKLNKKLKECVEEKEKYLKGWQLSQADFINYRRRQEEQATEWSRMYEEGLIRDILPVLDSLDAALIVSPEDEGLKTLAGQLKSVLKKHGLQEIKAVGEKFNPQFHEVVECEEEGEEHGGETVSAEIQKGYLLNGKLLRAAKVRIRK